MSKAESRATRACPGTNQDQWEAQQLTERRMENMEACLVTETERGTRLVGPYGGLKKGMPSPTNADLTDPVFEAIWQATKTWDINAPEYYVGYCGMNGSHVMLILNAIRALAKDKD